MSNKSEHRLIDSVLRMGRKRSLVFYGIFFACLVAPIVFIGVFSYRSEAAGLTEGALARRESIAYLAAATLAEKFDRLTDLAVSFATRVKFRQLVVDGEWEEAVKILEQVPKDFPFIERVFLAAPDGVLKADTPELPGVRGVNFSHRDWYLGVSGEWRPYVSEVYKRTAEPRYNVVAVAAPINDGARKVVGILVMQVRLDTFFDWARKIDVGPSAFEYFVDPGGNAVGHPRFPPQGDIADFSSVPAVQKALRGEQGVEQSYDSAVGEDIVVAYGPVPRYGWGVLVAQPSRTVFASRDANLRLLAAVFGLFFLLGCLFAFIALRLLSMMNIHRQQEKIILESIGDGIVAIDRNWTVTHWNKAAAAIAGWSRDEALGKPFRSILKFIREHDRKENIAFIEHALVMGEVGNLENGTVLIRKDGREIPVGDSASPVFDDAGRVTGAIVIFRDITKEREYQMLRSDFAYASHQLRTPVNKMMWSVQTALETAELGAVKDVLRGAEQSMKSLVKMVNKLAVVSEVDQEKVIPRPAPVKLVDIVGSALKAVEAEAEARGVSVVVEPLSAIASIETDSKLLSWSLAEILENAVVFSSAGGEVRVRVIIQERNAVIEVRDSGAGIPEHERPLVFHKFFRGSNFDTTAISGAGLGLYVSNEYVKLLRGKIWFTSEEKKGTTFFISLPLKIF